MKGPIITGRAAVLAALCIVLMSSTALSQSSGDLRGVGGLVRSLICLLFWILPVLVGVLFVLGGFLAAFGDSGRRVLGKQLLVSAVSGVIVLLVLAYVVSAVLPGVDLRICYGSLPFVSNQYPLAEARVGFDQRSGEKRVEITQGDNAYFDGSLSVDPDGSIASYTWDFGDGSSGAGESATHIYSNLGEFFAKLWVTDDKGAVSRVPSVVRVIVNPPLTVSGGVVPGPAATTSTTLSSLPSSTKPRPSTTSTTYATTTTAGPPKLTIAFVPLGWKGTLAEFDAAVAKHAQFFIDSIPLKDCPSKVKILKAAEVCPVSAQALSSCDSRTMINAIIACADKLGSYDYAVGLHDDESTCGDYKGFSMTGSGAVYCEVPYSMVTAHEIGHQWDLNDEYCDSCRCGVCPKLSDYNCLDASKGGSDAITSAGYTSAYCAGGNQCPSSYKAVCEGNLNEKGGRCIMSHSAAAEPRAFCSHCWSHLLTIPNINC